ncbi:putative zinc finger, C2H2 type [Lyophyllum shimeji]|uniref:Zinc finger, C2H2 type n=1 Tax=Lyophyllum shimeji TaxID=47721 RepID=A0A9P3Q2G4_LYOSH|nr:putative zinc finger, C2H2 type [Lyophyllum shimeji]
MDRKSSPERSSPDPSTGPGTSLDAAPHDDQQDMAAMVASAQPQNLPGPVAGVNKRYRPAPAKTFQCRGYGDCRMVFSRSEHLARHIRKHTGERPFTCHCGKQFSRLDNLRQHAQTVHADKQEQNERMMRELTSLHATMAAANKVGNPRGGRRTSVATVAAAALPPQSPQSPNGDASPALGVNGVTGGMDMIKQEDLTSMPIHHRAESAGYDTDQSSHSMLYHQPSSWHVHPSDLEPRPSSRGPHPHSQSFRDPSQSFRDPTATPAGNHSQSFLPPTHGSAQPFLPFSPNLPFGLPNEPSRSGTGSRPGTSGERLPPLSAIVSASIPGSTSSSGQHTATLQQYQQQHQAQQQHQPSYASSPPGQYSHAHNQQHLFSTHLRPRPTTASGRPTSSSSATSFYPTPSLNPSKSFYGPSPGTLQYARSYPGAYDTSSSDVSSTSPTGGQGQDSSPFYFQPPAADAHPQRSTPPHHNPRKRAFAGPDGPLHSYEEMAGYAPPSHPHLSHSQHPPQHHPQHHPQQQQQHHTHHGPGPLDYDYGTESRPQSRRLSVLELCNDGDQLQQQQHQQQLDFGVGVGGGFLDGRPGTASGLGIVGNTGALSIFDRGSGSPPQGRGGPSPAGSRGSGGARSRTSQDSGVPHGNGNGEGRVSPPSRRVTPAQNGQGHGGHSNGYPPPPRPHSTAYSVSSTSSNSPPHHLQAQQQFAYAQAQAHHQLQQQQRHQQAQSYSMPLDMNLAAMGVNVPVGVGMYPSHPAASPTSGSSTPASAFAPPPAFVASASSSAASSSRYQAGPGSPTASSVSGSVATPPVSPMHAGHGVLAHQQAQSFQALQQQAQAQQGYSHAGYESYGAGQGGYAA